MFLFHDMTTITISTIIAVALLITFVTGRQPLAVAGIFFKKLFTSRNTILFLASMLLILIINKNELRLEHWMEVSYDLTGTLTGWEGSWISTLQNMLQSRWLTAFCAIFYVIVFQSVMISSAGIYIYEKNMKLYYAFCVALLLNYTIAVPFYIFVPVFEVWYANPNVEFLMLHAFPNFETVYRPMSGIDNCFPSLHTSLSVTMALLASRSGIRRWAIFAGTHAVIILFSILYLGIHWFTDMAAGIVLAVFCAGVGLRVGSWMEVNVTDWNWSAALRAKSGARNYMDS